MSDMFITVSGTFEFTCDTEEQAKKILSEMEDIIWKNNGDVQEFESEIEENETEDEE